VISENDGRGDKGTDKELDAWRRKCFRGPSRT